MAEDGQREPGGGTAPRGRPGAGQARQDAGGESPPGYGNRLTFRNGILLLSVTSAAIYIAFRGNTESLLPLYAVGVFLAFTLSQTGMIMHRRHAAVSDS